MCAAEGTISPAPERTYPLSGLFSHPTNEGVRGATGTTGFAVAPAHFIAFYLVALTLKKRKGMGKKAEW